MVENLLGYLLGALDERGVSQVEAYLAQHPEARAQLAQLQQALEPLGLDREPTPPPPYLTERTIARIAEHICAPAVEEDLPIAPPVSPSSSGRPSWWRRIDVLVAACLLVTVTGIGLVTLARMRAPTSSAMLVECKNNLREFFFALQRYRDQHREFPDVAKESPRDVAGMVVPILNDAGTLSSNVSIRCPAVGTPMTCSFSRTALRDMTDTVFAQHAPCLSMCYAYSLGFKDEAGVVHGPGSIVQTSLAQMPIMADRPPTEGTPGNSFNHGGLGQNVLFADGHVRFLPQRTFGEGDDIFMNRNKMVAAGLDATDVVLGFSAARP